MRGKGITAYKPDSLTGITPAYAGKRLRGRRSDAAVRDHPRLCGEKVKTNGKSATERGSPPPMRGKVLLWIVVYKRGRITPAYAGKSFLSTSRAFCNQDHPRLCGEKV